MTNLYDPRESTPPSRRWLRRASSRWSNVSRGSATLVASYILDTNEFTDDELHGQPEKNV
jgi:hypothetical protein